MTAVVNQKWLVISVQYSAVQNAVTTIIVEIEFLLLTTLSKNICVYPDTFVLISRIDNEWLHLT